MVKSKTLVNNDVKSRVALNYTMKTKEKKKTWETNPKILRGFLFEEDPKIRFSLRPLVTEDELRFLSIIQVFHIYFLSERQLFDHRSSSLVSRQCYSHQCINGFFSRILYLIYKEI